MAVFGYLRVSSDKQDVASQQIGVERKAAELNVSIEEWIKDEGISGTVEYKKRNLGVLIGKAKSGDSIIVSEISRLARSVFMLFRIVEYCIDNEIVIYSVKDNTTIKKGDLIATMAVFFFGIAAQIEREMIVKRTIEGLERRRKDGVVFGRKMGKQRRNLKLEGKKEDILKYVNAGVNPAGIARIFKVHRHTIEKWCAANDIDYQKNVKPMYQEKIVERNNKHKEKSDFIMRQLQENKAFLLECAKQNLYQYQVIEKLNEKGIKIGQQRFLFYLKKADIYDEYLKIFNENREIKNVDCGSQRKYYKF
ncbi:MAG: recombinase family protein [Prevotellaceae bacterium]|jgi:DNA invertase Pin-like site-specific DNA recombinase|nr:recombinase family protein [Prevotellaceae bacterium]